MYKRIVGSGLLLCLMALATPASAIPIVGEIFSTGRYVTDSGDLANATQLQFLRAWTTDGSGDYSAAASTRFDVMYENFTFRPALSGPVDPLWWFSDGSTVYSFVMNSVDVTTQTSTMLEMIGFGMLYITGFDPTPGIWEFSTTCTNEDCTGRFKFTAETTVPEPGSLALLGLGLFGLGMARRRRVRTR